MSSRDVIPNNLRISFYHEALVYFILQYSDKSLVDELAEAVKTGNLLEKLEEYHFLNDGLDLHFPEAPSKWMLYHQVVQSIAREYGVSTNFVKSTTIAIIAALGGDGQPSVSKLWSLFITEEKDLAHLKLINTELFYWRREIIRVWEE